MAGDCSCGDGTSGRALSVEEDVVTEPSVSVCFIREQQWQDFSHKTIVQSSSHDTSSRCSIGVVTTVGLLSPYSSIHLAFIHTELCDVHCFSSHNLFFFFLAFLMFYSWLLIWDIPYVHLCLVEFVFYLHVNSTLFQLYILFFS